MRRHEQALIQQAVLTHRTAAFAADAGCGQLVGGVLHQIGTACNIAAGRGQAAARVLDERACDDVRTDLRRLDLLSKFAVAVIDHDGRGRVDLAHGLTNFADFLDRKRLADAVAAAALDKHQLDILICRRCLDGRQVRLAVLEVNLPVADAVALHAAAVIAGDGVLQRVIRRSGDGQHGVAGLDGGKHRAGERVCAVYKADTHECGLGAENIGVDLVERVTAVVIIAVAGRAREQIVGYSVLRKCRQHLLGVAVTDLLETLEIRTDLAFSLTAERTNLR